VFHKLEPWYICCQHAEWIGIVKQKLANATTEKQMDMCVWMLCDLYLVLTVSQLKVDSEEMFNGHKEYNLHSNSSMKHKKNDNNSNGDSLEDNHGNTAAAAGANDYDDELDEVFFEGPVLEKEYLITQKQKGHLKKKLIADGDDDGAKKNHQSKKS
jgi:hypothetical protein